MVAVETSWLRATLPSCAQLFAPLVGQVEFFLAGVVAHDMARK